MPGHLLFHACDPAECRQYVNVQLNTLPLALFLARVLNRTLVLPPFMIFRNQGQPDMYADGGHDQIHAYYRPFGTYFNVSGLQAAADVIEFDNFLDMHDGMLPIDRLWYTQHKHVMKAGPETCVALTRKLFTTGGVLGAPAKLGDFQCGQLDVNGVHGYERWLEDYAPARLAPGMKSSIEGVGTLMVLGEWWGSTNYPDEAIDPTLLPPPTPSSIVAMNLHFNDELHVAASSFISAHLSAGFVSVHWRHGDYINWRKQAPPDTVATFALEALDNASAPSPRHVFLATNCKDVSQIREVERLLTKGGAKLVRYFSGDGVDRPRAAFLEQIIASHASTFIYSAASFFSQTIVRERRNKQLGPSLSMHGMEQKIDFEQMRELERSGIIGPNATSGPGATSFPTVPIFEQPLFPGASLGIKDEL